MIGAVVVRPLQCVEAEAEGAWPRVSTLHPPVTSQWWSATRAALRGNIQPVKEQIIFESCKLIMISCSAGVFWVLTGITFYFKHVN